MWYEWWNILTITQDCEDLAQRTLQFFGNYRLENSWTEWTCK